MTCPKCKRGTVEQHDINLTPYHWWLCRECGAVWDDKTKEE